MKLLKSIEAILCLYTVCIRAWYGSGHLLVARVAYEILQKENPETVDNVEKTLLILKKSDPDWTLKEDKYPFVECTTFADDIKFKGGNY